MKKSVELEELFFGNFAECPIHPHRDIKTKDGTTKLAVCDFCKAVSYQGCPECEGECEIITCEKCKKEFCPKCGGGSGSTCKKCLSISSSSKNGKPHYYSRPWATEVDYTIDEYPAEEVEEPEWTPIGDEDTGSVKVEYGSDPDIEITMDYDSSDPGDTDYDIDYDY